MRVEILYFEGCPHHRPTVELVKAVVRDRAVVADVEEVEVRDQAEAERLRFLGSPSIRIDGIDIEGGASGTTYGLSCRLYGASGIPPRAQIEAALTRGG